LRKFFFILSGFILLGLCLVFAIKNRENFTRFVARSMVVITTEEYRQAVEPLVKWKNRKGIETSLFIYPRDTGATPEDIKSFLKKKYYSKNGLDYILIVGDAEDIPPARGYIANAKGLPSDPVYTLLEGNDEYPDAAIGRFSVEDVNQARTVVNKNLWYERDPDPEGKWYHKAMGIAADDRYFTPDPREIMDEICEKMLTYTFTEFTKIYDPDSTPSQLSEVVNRGVGWINAQQHGYSYGWGGIKYQVSDVMQLKNSYKTPIVIASSCLTGNFEAKTCFAEAWQRLGTPDKPRGSILFMGSTAVIWHFAWVAQKEMIRSLVDDNCYIAGELIIQGIKKTINMFPDGPKYEGQEIFQMWHLFGDPSLFLYTDKPTEMKVTHAENLPLGSKGLAVNVKNIHGTQPRALVALYMDDTLMGSAFTNKRGKAFIRLEEPLQKSGIMEVNATAYNELPYFGTIKVGTK
jgi:hypothetical protein